MKKIVSLLIAATLLSSLFTGCQMTKKASGPDKAPVILSKNALEESKIPETFQEVAGMLNNIQGYKMPYFGGYSLEDQQIIIHADGEDKAILWQGDGKGISVIDKNDIPEEKRFSSFAEGEYLGKKTTFVNQDQDGKMAFILAVHEGYHFYGQAWVDAINFKHHIPRGILYPEQVQARNLMNQADKKLRDHMDGNNDKGLEEALYFINQARKNHSQDLEGNLNTAISEGTANFVENLYVALALDPSLKDKPQALAQKAYQVNKVNVSGEFLDKGMEYYHASSLPLYYLASKGHQELLDTLMAGKHSLELLNELGQEKVSDFDASLSKAVTAHYQEANDKAASTIASLKAQINDPAYVQVKIATELFPGSMAFGEFINFETKDQYKTVNTLTTAKAQVSHGQAELTGKDTMDSNDYKYYVFYVKQSSVQAGKTLSIEENGVIIKDVEYTIVDGAYTIGS